MIISQIFDSSIFVLFHKQYASQTLVILNFFLEPTVNSVEAGFLIKNRIYMHAGRVPQLNKHPSQIEVTSMGDFN